MAVRTTFEIIDFLNNTGDLSITATDLDNNTQVVISSADALQYVTHKYPTRRYSVIRGSAGATTSDANNDFVLDFRLWVKNRQHNIDKQYQALFDYNYSPIENVDRYESETINRDLDTTYGKKDTESGTTGVSRSETTDTDTTNGVTESGSDSVTKSGNIQTENSRSGMNTPNDYTKRDKSVETYNTVKDKTDYGKEVSETGTVDTSVTGNETTTHGKVLTESGTDTTNDDTLRTLRVHGNIGVTRSDELVGFEIETRKLCLAEMLLDNFINDYTFYS